MNPTNCMCCDKEESITGLCDVCVVCVVSAKCVLQELEDTKDGKFSKSHMDEIVVQTTDAVIKC